MSFVRAESPVIAKSQSLDEKREQEPTWFRRVLAELPHPLARRLVSHREDRFERACGRPMLGEYAIDIFSDLLHLGEASKARAEIPWLLLYEHALLIDDLLDGPSKQCGYDLILSQVLLDKAHRAISTLVGDGDIVLRLFERYRMESWTAMIQEMEWSQGKREEVGSEEALLLQGRKSALAKFCATLLRYADRGEILTQEQERGIDALCSGIQLLDDLADCHEDHSNGRMNRTLQTAIRWLSHRFPRHSSPGKDDPLGPSQLVAGLVLSGSVASTWITAAGRFEEALDLLKAPVGACATEYFTALGVQCRQSSIRLGFLTSQGGEGWNCLDEVLLDEAALTRELAEGKLSKLWQEILQCLSIGPQASN